MGWGESSDMLFSTYSVDYESHDPKEVLDLCSGAINSVQLSLETLGLVSSVEQRPSSVSPSIALEVLENEEFDPN